MVPWLRLTGASLVLAASAVAAIAIGAPGGEEEALAAAIRAGYTKLEYRVPMRDGVRLHTAVYVPKDRSRRWPILMTRTPYGAHPYGVDVYPEKLGPTPEFVEEGFIFVVQDVRGRFMSEGEFVNLRPHRSVSGERVDESTDTTDTIAWLLGRVPAHNGRVGLWGSSYPGFYTSMGIIDGHPALVAASPQAPIADWFWDDMHRHGAFVLPLAFNFFATFGQVREGLTSEWPPRFDHGTPDGYQFFLDLGPLGNANARHFGGRIPFWNDIVRHPNYDEFWSSRNILPHLKGVKAAVLVVGGLFDTEDLYGPLATYAAIERLNPDIENNLVMGPWPHGGWLRLPGDTLGEAQFGFATGEDFRRRILLPFFVHHLKGECELDLAEATVFETGANRWRTFDSWPPPRASRTAYLRAGGVLAWGPPREPGADTYHSDPARPVPYTQEITTGWSSTYVTEDQRFAARRPDVLVYRTEPLKDDLTVAGPMRVRLTASTTGEDVDFIVKLVDEYPVRVPGWRERDGDDAAEDDDGGTQRLVRVEAFRGRFRTGYEHPQPFVPGQRAEISFPLQDVLHTFGRGHRIMVQVQSTWFPMIDRNPQSWVDNIFEAEAGDFIPASITVHRAPDRPSSIELGVLE